MKLLYVTPNPIRLYGQGGAAVTNVWCLEHFLRRGFDVTVLYFETPTIGETVYTAEEKRRDHEAMLARGVKEVRSLVRPDIPAPATYPKAFIRRQIAKYRDRIAAARGARALSDALAREVDATNPDLCFLFTETVFYATGITGTPMVNWSPPPQIPFWRIHIDLGWSRIWGQKWLAELYHPIRLFLHRRSFRKWIDAVDVVLCPSAWYAKLFIKIARDPSKIVEFPHPAADEARGFTCGDPASPPPNRPFVVMIVGHLRSTFSSAAFKFLATEILPELERRGLTDRLEFHLIGKFEPVPNIAPLLNHKCIRRLGYVENLGDAVNRSDVVLQAMPYAPGVGMRLSALTSAYPCLVLHDVIGRSLPEFRHDENCLLAKTGSEFVDAIMKACEDRDLNRRLRIGARATYEKYYHVDHLGTVLDSVVEKATAHWRKRHLGVGGRKAERQPEAV